MKKTVTANIAGIIFHIDEDAYDLLSRYLNTIRSRYDGTEGRDEIINDIETRISEILQTKINNAKQVISIEDVNNVIEIMGKPEQFEGDEKSNNATDDETRAYKKLYRDDDDKLIAGVCSGIAAYFNVDSLWIRIGFIATTLLFSTGLWIYLILWIIVPKARTTKEKLEMKGKKINISNIENTIREDLNDLKVKFNDFKDEARDTFKSKKKRKGIDKFFYFLFLLIKYFAKSIGIVLGVIFIFVGIFLFIGFISSFFSTFPIHFGIHDINMGNISVPALLNLFYPSDFFIYVSIIGIIFLIATPLIMFIYYGFKLVFGLKYHSKLIGFTSFSLWIIGLVLCLISAFQVARSFSNKAVSTEKFISQIEPEQKIILDIKANEMQSIKFENEALQLGHLALVSDSSSQILMGVPKIEICNNDNKNELEVLVLAISRGENKETALKNAKSINYPVILNDTVVELPAFYTVDKNLKWRHQELKIQIKVPPTNDVVYTKATREFLDKAL